MQLAPCQSRAKLGESREGVETGRAAPKDFGLRRRDSPDHERPTKAAAKAEVVRILGSWVRIPPRTSPHHLPRLSWNCASRSLGLTSPTLSTGTPRYPQGRRIADLWMVARGAPVDNGSPLWKAWTTSNTGTLNHDLNPEIRRSTTAAKCRSQNDFVFLQTQSFNLCIKLSSICAGFPDTPEHTFAEIVECYSE